MEKFETVEEVISKLKSERMQETVKQIIEYGRHLDKVRHEHPEVISSGDLISYLINNGMAIDLAVQIKLAIENVQSEIVLNFKA